jgi:hypothetical protein
VKLEGSLDAFTLPDIFSLLSMTKKTGGLHLRRAGEHGAVWLAEGQLTGGASDLTRASLGRRLAGSGAVDDDTLLDAVTRAAEDPEIGVARALREADAVDVKELQSLDAVFDLLRWPDGDFAFVLDEANIDDVGVTRSVEDVVSEARSRLDSWTTSGTYIPSAETVLTIALNPDEDPDVTREEWALLALVDARRTVAEIVDLCGRGEYSVVVALAELVGRGLIEVDSGEGVSALARRQRMLGTLEHEPASGPKPKAKGKSKAASRPELVVDEPVEPLEPESTDATEDSAESEPATEEEPETVIAVARIVEDIVMDGQSDNGTTDDLEVPAQRFTRPTGVPRDLSAVTPQRPEPFIPARVPDHPEPALAVGGGAAAAAAHAIERDPSVNKSLLLRLIAGVRGL